MKNLELNKWLVFYLFLITTSLIVFYAMVQHSEKSQNAIMSHISDDLIPQMRATIQIRDELIDIKKSMHGINELKGDIKATEIELSRIRTNDTAIQRGMNSIRYGNSLQEDKTRLIELDKAYQLLHLELAYISGNYIVSITDEDIALIEVAIKDALNLNENLINQYQALIHQYTKALAEQSIASNHLLIGFLFLWGVVVGIGHQFYRKVVEILGAPPKQFISDISQLISSRPLSINHPHDSLIGQVEHLLSFDTLTGLPNILGIKKWLGRPNTKFSNVVYFLIHIDGLNLLKNHYHNSKYKDEIQQFINHVTTLLPVDSCLGSLDTENFLIVSTSISEEREFCKFAETLQDSIRNHSLSLAKLSMLKISIGIANSSNYNSDLDGLLKNALLALAHAKEKKGNQYVLFKPDLITQQKVRLEVLSDIKKALQENAFSLVFQPQVDCHSQDIVGVEALIRWNHPVKGPISPGVFIPLAEESGLIVEVGNWVIEHAIDVASKINSQRTRLVPVSINVSSHQFLSTEFTAKIAQLLSAYQCDPTWIKLEITESIMLNASSELRRTMMEIAQTGVSICLDDFCTGYSSLSYLTQYPISQIKIDRGFISDIAILFDNRELVRSIVRIAEVFKFEIVAEGVETEEQLAFISGTSCRIIQGFLYYKPLPYDDLVKVLHTAIPG